MLFAVNRINDPAEAAKLTTASYAKFLALNSIIRKCGGNDIAKGGFGLSVSNCDRGLIGFFVV